MPLPTPRLPPVTTATRPRNTDMTSSFANRAIASRRARSSGGHPTAPSAPPGASHDVRAETVHRGLRAVPLRELLRAQQPGGHVQAPPACQVRCRLAVPVPDRRVGPVGEEQLDDFLGAGLIAGQ